jgi:hypothetical protein
MLDLLQNVEALIKVVEALAVTAVTIIGIIRGLEWGSKLKLEKAVLVAQKIDDACDTAMRYIEQVYKFTPQEERNTSQMKVEAIEKAVELLGESVNVGEVELRIEKMLNIKNQM